MLICLFLIIKNIFCKKKPQKDRYFRHKNTNSSRFKAIFSPFHKGEGGPHLRKKNLGEKMAVNGGVPFLAETIRKIVFERLLEFVSLFDLDMFECSAIYSLIICFGQCNMARF